MSEPAAEPQEYELRVDQVWRSTDRRFPNRRVQLTKVVEGEYWVAVQAIDRAGMPFGASQYLEGWTQFAFGDAYVPDDTGWPSPCVTVNGQLHLLEPPPEAEPEE